MVMHSSFGDFVLFLYVHMAHADGDYHPDESQVILEKMSKIFPSETNPRQKLDKAVSEYKSLNAEQIGLIIRESFKHFTNVKFTQKYKVYTDMYDIINADGKVDESETKALSALKEIIDIGAN